MMNDRKTRLSAYESAWKILFAVTKENRQELSRLCLDLRARAIADNPKCLVEHSP